MTFTTFRLRVTDCEVEPLSPVTVMAYKPGGVAPVVVTVSEGLDGGVAGSGLTRHSGVPVVCTGVTVQGIVLNETGLLDPLGSTSLRSLDTKTVGPSWLSRCRLHCVSPGIQKPLSAGQRYRRSATWAIQRRSVSSLTT